MLFPLEEKFAQSVCFLLVDLYLLTFQPEKALHLLTVLDKLSVQGSNKNGKGEVDTNTVCVIKNRNVHNKSKPISVHIQDRLLEQHCRHLLLLIEYSLIICSVQTHRLSYQRLL